MTVHNIKAEFKKWVSPKDAAMYLGCSDNFLAKDRMNRLHGIPFSRLGRHVRYFLIDLDAFLESQKVGGGK